MAIAAADTAADAIRRHVARSGRVRLAAATAASQLAFQRELVSRPGIDWANVELFQLDEYIGLPEGHPSSFRNQLTRHLVAPAGIGHAHLIDAVDPVRACESLKTAMAAAPLDLAFLGIGENGHLAFNDPPADFDTDEPYIVVPLDDACRRQQVGEGWFPRIEDVPQVAITMSIRAMLGAREILVIVPGAHKAAAVRAAVSGPITPLVPASILQTHENVTLFRTED